jgi:hypothetical protein
MKRFQDVLLALLVVGIAVQIWTATVRTPEGDNQSSLVEPLAVGDTLPVVTGYGELGIPVTVSLLSDDAPQVTVIYSFHPDCAHSRSWGRGWARHFDQGRVASDEGRRR